MFNIKHLYMILIIEFEMVKSKIIVLLLPIVIANHKVMKQSDF